MRNPNFAFRGPPITIYKMDARRYLDFSNSWSLKVINNFIENYEKYLF